MLSKSQKKRRGMKRRMQEGLGKTRYPNGLDPRRFADAELKQQVKKRDLSHCRYCQAFVGDKARIDHVVAHSRGGATVITNLVLSCRRCTDKRVWKPNMQPKTLKNHERWMKGGDLVEIKKKHPSPNIDKPLALLPDFLVDPIGTNCKHRRSPLCERRRCLQQRRSEKRRLDVFEAGQFASPFPVTLWRFREA